MTTLSRLRGGARLARWPVLELLVTVAVQLVLTPLLLHRLGATQFGVWVLAQTALLAATTLSLGASAGVLPVLSAAWQQGDVAGAAAALRRCFGRVAVSVALALAVIAVPALSGWVPGFVPEGARAGFWPLVLAVLAWMAVTELDNVVVSALKSQSRFGFAALTETAARLAQLALVLLLVAEGSPALGPVLVSLGVASAKVLVRLAALRAGWPAAGERRPAAAAPGGVSRAMAVTGAWVWLGALGGLTFNAFDRWFIGAWLGPATLAAYAVCLQLAQLPHAVAAAASQVLVPWAARQAAGGAARPAEGITPAALAVATALAALPALLLLPLLEPVLARWISPEFAQAHLPLARGLTLAFLVLCLNVPAYFVLLGLGQARFTTLVHALCGLLFVAGALLLPPALSTFVALKIGFAVLTLAMPIGCALRLRAPARLETETSR